MTRESILRLISSRFGSYTYSGDEIQVNCPFCVLRGLTPNTTKKLSINIVKMVHYCFRCEFKGKLADLIPQLAILSVAADKMMKQMDGNQVEPLPADLQRLDQLEYPWDTMVDLCLNPKGWMRSDLISKAYFCQDYKKNTFSFGPRLIFPIYQLGTYRGFQGRTVYQNHEVKYIGATNMNRRTILYNYDTAFSQKDLLIVVEGFLDQIRVGNQAVATLGKNVTDEQVRIICAGQFDEVVVFLDPDANSTALTLARKLAIYTKSYISVPSSKDPGDMKSEEIMPYIQKTKERIR